MVPSGWLLEAGPKGSASFAVYSLPDTVHNAATMQIRYLVSIYEVNCAVPLRDHLSNLIATTAYIPDRNIYAANVTLAQWNKIREEYWATGRQCDHGRLVPSIDFVASDGKSFLDFEECRKHEHEIASRFNFSPRPHPDRLPDFAERSEFIAAKICADVAQYNNGEFCNAATEHRFQEWLVSKSQAGNKARVLLDQFNAVATDQEKQTLAEMAATCRLDVPACYQFTEEYMNNYVRSVIQKSQEAQGATDKHGNVVGAVGVEDAKHGYGKISGPGLSGKEPITDEVIIAETKPQYNPDPLTETATGLMIACRTDGPPVTLTTYAAPTSLMALVQSKLSVLAINGSQVVARFGRVKIDRTPSDEYAIPFVKTFECILAKEIEDQGATLILYGIHPAFDEFTYHTQEETMPPWYSVDFETQEVTRCVEKTLEDRMLVVVGSNYMNIGLVASLLKTDENAVRAVAKNNNKFEMSSTQKSLRKV